MSDRYWIRPEPCKRWLYVLGIALAFASTVEASQVRSDRPPNIIIILADDLGYGDIGINGARQINTPYIDQLAREGVSLSSFYASANVCTPSRAGLLTGRYAIRSGLAYGVVEAEDGNGLPPDEITIAEILKPRGYRTAIIGKWHLGHSPQYWPTQQGFDYYYGLPYSNDMQDVALYRGTARIEDPVEQSTLTERYTAEAIRFIEENRSRPFFLYLAHTFPHIPLHVSDEFAGRSRAGLYGDVVEVIDWSTGQIVDALRRHGLDEDTLIVFTSDNGAWFEGSPGDARDAKGTTWDGGYLVPFVARWPGRIAAGTRSDALTMNIDILPTIARLAGARMPDGRIIDGRDLWEVTQGSERSPHEVLYFFNNEDISAVRTERWKLLMRTYYRTNLAAFERFKPGVGFDYWLLFDMRDPEPERYSRAREYPEILENMLAAWQRGREEFESLRLHPPPRLLP